jgi:hypothetical protein
MSADSNSRENSSPAPQSNGVIEESRESSPSGASEDQVLATLQAAEVTAEEIARLARNAEALKSRKVLLALVMHARTPRHISIPLLRGMFTFDLMQVTLTAAVAADIKRAAEQQILLRIESLSPGEKISLARRASGRVAAELLRDTDGRVVSVALDNSRLTESGVVAALTKLDSPETLFQLASRHEKWSQRCELQIALLKSEKTPIEEARKFAMHFSPSFLGEIVPEVRRAELLKAAETIANDCE